MFRALHRATVTVAALAVAAGGALAASPAQAATVQVRPADLVAPTDTAGGGTQEFLAQGIHLKTVDGSGYARGRFHVGVPLAQVTKVDYTWYGTQFAPGVKHYVDVNADGKVDGELRGELTYGGQDVWLNLDTQDFPGSGLPNGFLAANSPCDGTAVNAGAAGPCGPSGAADHGTLADWAKKLQAATGKAPVLVDGGYALSGDVGNGVLTQITYGPHTYSFTNQPKARVIAKAQPKRDQIRMANKAKVVGEATPVGPGARITLEVKKQGKWTFVKVRNLAADGDFKLGAKPVKLGVNRFRVTVAETNSTAAATSNVVKVRVTRK